MVHDGTHFRQILLHGIKQLPVVCPVFQHRLHGSVRPFRIIRNTFIRNIGKQRFREKQRRCIGRIIMLNGTAFRTVNASDIVKRNVLFSLKHIFHHTDKTVLGIPPSPILYHGKFFVKIHFLPQIPLSHCPSFCRQA